MDYQAWFSCTSSISIRKITKDNYPSEVYEDKAERIEFEFAFGFH